VGAAIWDEIGWTDPDKRDSAIERLLTDIRDYTPKSELSPGELRSVVAASHGLTDNQIAELFFLSPNTIKGQMKLAYGKLHANNRAHSVAIALRTGLIL
jgi:DNA-binding CsgD family transcriptional regulator